MTASIAESTRLLRRGDATSRELTEMAFDSIADVDPALASFVIVDHDGALEAAETADRLLTSGVDVGPLAGVPVAVKDIIHMSGLPTGCGSPAYGSHAVEHDATVVSRLRAAGAVIVGKTTAHELACGVYSAPASNPWATDRIPGGSSGGSGAAVAAGLVPMALGSDTGGSIRIPAALCGIAGLKPTYGLVSRAGVEPLSWTLDHIGPLAATVADCAVTLEAIAGFDPADPSTARHDTVDFSSTLDAGVSELRIGILTSEPFSPMQPDVEAAMNDAVEILRLLGAEPVNVDIAELRYTLAAEFGIVGPEAALYHRDLLASNPGLIDPGIRGLLLSGTLLPGAQYLKALEARAVIAEAIRDAFIDHRLDVVVSPTLPSTAAQKDQVEFVYEDMTEDVTLSYVRTTAPFNLSGQPALSIPCGYDGHGLPVGLQIAGKPFNDATVLRVGAAYEAATPWHLDTPPVHVAMSTS